jgi:ABC-type xylose transport system permease subunit
MFLPEDVTIGSSGCLAGLMGSMMADLLVNWKFVRNPYKTLVSLGVEIIIFLLIGKTVEVGIDD